MRHIPITLLALAASIGFASAQTTATTTPVGYITNTIAGNPTSNVFGADTYVAPTLVRDVVYASASNAAPVDNVISFAGTSVPTDLDGTYYLEITSGTREGWWTTVTSSTSSSITVVDDFPTGIGSAVTVAVRKFTTLQSWLGENTLGLGSEDEVQILDPVAQTVKAVKYVGGDWQDLVLETIENEAIIYPGTAVRIRVFGASDITLVASGTVKTTKTEVDVFPNTNWLGAPLAGGSTFGGLNFGTQINQEDYNPVTNPPADYIETIAPDQSATSYISVGGVMYGVVSEADASAEPVAAGSGLGLFRDFTGGESILVYPPQVVAP